MSLPAPCLRRMVAHASINGEGREIYLIKYTTPDGIAGLKNNSRVVVTFEEVPTVWGKRTMYVVRQKGHD